MMGPGTHLMKILNDLGLHTKDDCECKARCEKMDEWGPAGCREHLDEIVDWLRDAQHKRGWRDHIVAGWRALRSGLGYQLNPMDPAPGLVQEAIQRAEMEVADGGGE